MRGWGTENQAGAGPTTVSRCFLFGFIGASLCFYVLLLAVGLSFLIEDVVHQQTENFRHFELFFFSDPYQVHQYQSVC